MYGFVRTALYSGGVVKAEESVHVHTYDSDGYVRWIPSADRRTDFARCDECGATKVEEHNWYEEKYLDGKGFKLCYNCYAAYLCDENGRIDDYRVVVLPNGMEYSEENEDKYSTVAFDGAITEMGSIKLDEYTDFEMYLIHFYEDENGEIHNDVVPSLEYKISDLYNIESGIYWYVDADDETDAVSKHLKVKATAGSDGSIIYDSVVFAGELIWTKTGEPIYTGAKSNTRFYMMGVDFFPAVSYRTHVQKEGWQSSVGDGATSGTTGKGLRLEGIEINLGDLGYEGGIEYATHIQSIGWQDWKSNGEMSGTEGRALRLEAIKIRLTGDLANYYDVYYRVHAQKFGWLGWTMNGRPSGTSGYAYRLEAIQIKLVPKSETEDVPETSGLITDSFKKAKNVSYQTHVQSYGWQSYVSDGAMSGTSGQAKRLEGIRIKLDSPEFDGGIEYQTHVQSYGWQPWVSNGEMSGTSGQAKRLEGIRIRLTGEMAKYYSVTYRVHVQSIGWQDWKSDGEMAGTEGRALRLEGIEIKLVAKKYEYPAHEHD